jgi:GNAT superfamily N-acetyltransferase
MAGLLNASRQVLRQHVEHERAGFSDAIPRWKHLAEDAYQRVLRHYHLLYLAGSAVHFLMEVEGQIVACSGAFLKDDLPYCFYRQPTYGFLGDVYTRPAYRRQGYARQLTTKAIDWLNGRGVEMIRLLATPPAQALYVKLGFEPSGEMILRLNHP